MRENLVKADVLEAVIGLGPNLFYNSPMEACVVVCRTRKPAARKGKVLFINAVNHVTRERAQSFLTGEHISTIADAYRSFESKDGFTAVGDLGAIASNEFSLNIPLYVRPMATRTNASDLGAAVEAWNKSRIDLRTKLEAMLPDLAQAPK